MKLISVYLPPGDLQELDCLVRRNLYPTRAEAIRFAIKDLIRLHQSNETKGVES